MSSIDWSFGERVDCVSVMQQPVAPHNMSSPFPSVDVAESTTANHARRPSLAHTSASSQILRNTQPRPPVVGDASGSSSVIDLSGGMSLDRPVLQPRTSSFAGRKRSREEFADPYEDSDMSQPSTKAHSPGKIDLDGEDHMMLAEMSNGPAAEELAERLRASSMSGRPPLDSRKSIRLDADQAVALVSGIGPQSCTEDKRPDTGSSVGEPSHDPATLALGPSWSTMLPYSAAHPHLASAIRGWTVFLESNYPLRNVKFEWMKKSDPQGYLVGAIMAQDGYKWRGGSPGYFLFDEDLKRGRLLARSWGNALDALRSGVFEGEIMVATDHQFGYGLHGEGLEPEGAKLLQGQQISFPTPQDSTMAMDNNQQDVFVGMELD